MKYTLGTVCKLKGIDLEIIIIGYNGKGTSSDYIYEYTGCLLNEGYINSDKLYRFNGEHIETILFEGYTKKESAPQISIPVQNEATIEEKQESTSNSDKEEYIFDENGVLIEIRRPEPKEEVKEVKSEQVEPITLESIDINNL